MISYANKILADFRKKSTQLWGTPKNPGPTLGLEKDSISKCIGCAFEFPEKNKEKVVAYLKDREGPSFDLFEVEVKLPDGTVEVALVPINDPEKHTYIKDKNVQNLAEMVINAEGEEGKCFDYVKNIYTKLQEMNIQDPAVNELWSILSQKK